MALVIVIVISYCRTFPSFRFSYVCFTIVYDGYKTNCGEVFFFFKFVFQGCLVSSRAGSPAELVALVARVSKLLCATYYLTAVVAVSKL